MKILQLAHTLGAGGAERLVLNLCNKFSNNVEDEIVLVTIFDDSIPRNVHYLPELSPKVRFINLHCKTGLQPKAIWGVLKTIKREKPDIVHAHSTVLLLFLPVLFFHRIRYYHTIHTLAKRQASGADFISRRIMCFLYKRSKVKPITISQTCHQSYVDTYHINNDICINNGCDPLKTTEKYAFVKEEVDKLKKDSETIVFIHVARHHPIKNHKRLFDTFLRLEREEYNFVLIVLGDKYGALTDEFKDNRHIFLLGAKTNVGDYMAQANYFVLSSDAEGLPMTLIEAMSMGVVPISTPAGGVVDVIKDGITGYLAEDFRDEKFYQKVKQAIDNRNAISSKAVLNEYEEKYSSIICAEKYYKAYKLNK